MSEERTVGRATRRARPRVASLALMLGTVAAVALMPGARANSGSAYWYVEHVQRAVTELDDGSHGSPSAVAECEWHASTADTTPSASWTTAGDVGGFAIEVKARGTP